MHGGGGGEGTPSPPSKGVPSFFRGASARGFGVSGGFGFGVDGPPISPVQTSADKASNLHASVSDAWFDVVCSLGSCSGLHAAAEGSKHRRSHILTVVARFEASTLGPYIRAWQRWCLWCDSNALSPARPDSAALLDFLHECRLGNSGDRKMHRAVGGPLACMKAMRFVAKYAQLDQLQSVLHSPAADAYSKNSHVPRDRKEALPLPLEAVVWME